MLRALLSSARVPPALAFIGPDGTGKMKAAKEFAKTLNCLSPHDGEACGECQSCSQIDKGIDPDVRIVNSAFQAGLLDEEEEKQKSIKIDTVRELCKQALRKAMSSKWKVFVINDSHTLTPESANALLKVLEEPPDNTLWILLTKRREKLIPTVLSRCQSVEFRPLSESAVKELLLEQSIPEEEASFLAERCGGSAQKALKMHELRGTLSGIDPSSPVYPFAVSEALPKELSAKREDAGVLLELLLQDCHRKYLNCRAQSKRRRFADASRKFLRYQTYLTFNVTPDMILESALLEAGGLKLSFFKDI